MGRLERRRTRFEHRCFYWLDDDIRFGESEFIELRMRNACLEPELFFYLVPEPIGGI